MNKPALLILINKFDGNVKPILQGVIDAFENEIVILDTRGQREVISFPIEIDRQHIPLIILHATKSKAPKIGLDYFEQQLKDNSSGVILVDMNQGFTLMDIQIVAEAMDNIPDAIIIGGRVINQSNNRSSTFILSRLSSLTGARVKDFNSGLRGLPGCFISDLLDQKSTNLDIWMEMYVQAAKSNTQIIEVPINSQHKSKSLILFSFILNSTKLIYLFLRFSFLSMMTAGIDYAIFTILFLVSDSVLLSIIIARIAAGSFQFLMGKKWVFKSKNKLYSELIKYVLLVGILMLFSYLFIQLAVTNFGMSAIISKMIVELTLFVVSFTIQKRIVFANPGTP